MGREGCGRAGATRRGPRENAHCVAANLTQGSRPACQGHMAPLDLDWALSSASIAFLCVVLTFFKPPCRDPGRLLHSWGTSYTLDLTYNGVPDISFIPPHGCGVGTGWGSVIKGT